MALHVIMDAMTIAITCKLGSICLLISQSSKVNIAKLARNKSLESFKRMVRSYTTQWTVEVFKPKGKKFRIEGKVRVCNACWSLNNKKGTWKIPKLAKENPDVTFVLCGRYPEVPNLPNVIYFGHLNYPDLASVMRSCDIFLNLSENDPCPNVVLQGIASGLPILYKNSGGVPELVGECGLPVTMNNFRLQLDAVLKQRCELSEAARERAVNYFRTDHIFVKYLNAIIKTKRRQLPSLLDVVRLGLRGYPVIGNSIFKSSGLLVQLLRKT